MKYPKLTKKQIDKMQKNAKAFDELRLHIDNKRMKQMWKELDKPKQIDSDILKLIIDINEAGYYTFACCQGKTSLKEFDSGKHSPQAYIAFWKIIPDKIQEKLKQSGIVLYGENRDIQSINICIHGSPVPEAICGYRYVSEKHLIQDFSKKDKKTVINANKIFQKIVRKSFGL